MSEALYEEGEGGSNPALIARLVTLVQQEQKLDDDLGMLELDVKATKGSLVSLRQERIPAVMAELGTSSIALSELGDIRVEIDSFVAGTLPKDEPARSEAIKELIRLGGDALVQIDLTISFPKTELARADKLYEALLKKGYPVERKEGVNHQSFLAFVREALRSGANVHLNRLNLYAGKIAKIMQPKKAKAKKGK